MRTHGVRIFSSRVFAFIVLVAVGGTTSISGLERERSGVGVTVFADRNFRGQSATFSGDIPNLGPGLNNKISSLKIAPGEKWEICEDVDYQGRCVVMSGDEADLRKNSWNDVVSSLRRIGSSDSEAGPSDWYIVLYDQPWYRGNPVNYKGAASDLGGLNARAQSVKIGKGVWELCEDVNFGGRCVTLDENVPDLATHGMGRRVASVRPVPPVRPAQFESEPSPESDWYIILYDQPSYRGNPENYKGAVADLGGFNQHAQSVKIGKGVWELCEEVNFGGRCITLDESVPDLAIHGLDKRVSSVRPVQPQPETSEPR